MNNTDFQKETALTPEDKTHNRGDDNEGDEILGALSPIHFFPENRKVKDLLSAHVNQELDVRPSFQRGYVWDRKKASRLIESVLLNVPLPLIYTAEEDDGKEVVIDGQQRLLSLFGFIEGKFPQDLKPFKLSGLKKKTESGAALNGKKFSDLETKYQNKIKNYSIPIIKIASGSDPNVRFEIFERLNSGAAKLKEQELRNCIYRGPFNEFLFELAKDKNFCNSVGISPALTRRMDDAELVLRFLAFYDKTYLRYPNSMKEFLNDFMHRYQGLTDEGKKEEFSRIFKQAVDLSRTVFGEHAFRRFRVGDAKNPNGQWDTSFNRPLFDIVMWGFTQYKKHEVVPNSDAIREAFINLHIEDEKFRETITASQGGKTPVTYRFEEWKKRLDEILGSRNTQNKPRLFPAKVKHDLFKQSPLCAICQQTIQEIDDAEVDHIVPHSKGGATDISNAQLTHRFCNRSKSNKEQA